MSFGLKFYKFPEYHRQFYPKHRKGTEKATFVWTIVLEDLFTVFLWVDIKNKI